MRLLIGFKQSNDSWHYTLTKIIPKIIFLNLFYKLFKERGGEEPLKKYIHYRLITQF